MASISHMSAGRDSWLRSALPGTSWKGQPQIQGRLQPTWQLVEKLLRASWKRQKVQDPFNEFTQPVEYQVFVFLRLERKGQQPAPSWAAQLVNRAEVDVFLELSCFFHDPANVGNLISGSSAFSKSNLNIWKLTVHTLLKTGLENVEHYFVSMWDECNCAVGWMLLYPGFENEVLLLSWFSQCLMISKLYSSL